MIRVVLYIFLFLSVSINAQGQSKHTATIEGRVTNKDGEPERGVKVKMTEHCCFRAETTTDAYGMYKLYPGKGKYTITVRYRSGEEDSYEDLSVAPGKKEQLNFSERGIRHKEVIEEREEDDNR